VNLYDPYDIEQTEAHVHVGFEARHRVLSSAVYNGGLVDADHIVNLGVQKHHGEANGSIEPASLTLERYCRRMGWEGVAVGMMTAADIGSFRKVRIKEQGVTVAVIVTAGISNAKRAGDPAECRGILTTDPTTGTINIIALTDAILTPAAMVEAVQIVTEAKSAALQDLDIRSPLTGETATGTGTDAVAIASGTGPITLRYCGKHMRFGEILAVAVLSATKSALNR